jgi:endogenous inhibitor of DNA gyrase (YacG/DUF329 family)
MPTTECPICRKPVPIPADTEPIGFYPFCSERCKLVDLGRWLDGRYQIPVKEEEDEDGSPAGGDDDDDDDGKQPAPPRRP